MHKSILESTSQLQTEVSSSFSMTQETMTDDPVVWGNLTKMIGPEMEQVMGAESRGGNALTVEINGEHIPCAAINGYADKNTGAISAFGNIQNVDEDIVRRDGSFAFIVASSKHTLETTIVDIYTQEKAIEGESLRRLRESVELYNLQAPQRAHQEAEELISQYGLKAIQALGYRGQIG